MRAVALAAILACALVPSLAHAHQAGISRGVYTVHPTGEIDASIAFARRDFTNALDLPDEAAHTADALAALAPTVRATFVDGLHATADGRPCVGELVHVGVDDQDGIVVDARFQCPESDAGSASTDVAIDATFLDALISGHRHLARVEGANAPREEILFTGKTELHVSAPPMRKPATALQTMTTMFARACARITLPLFAFTAALPRVRARRAALVVAAIAVGVAVGGVASISAAARGIAPSAWLMAALAAAATVFLAAENVAEADDRLRPLFAATFGLVVGAQAAPTTSAEVLGVGACALLFAAVATGLGALLTRTKRPPARSSLPTRLASAVAGLVAIGLFVKSLVH